MDEPKAELSATTRALEHWLNRLGNDWNRVDRLDLSAEEHDVLNKLVVLGFIQAQVRYRLAVNRSDIAAEFTIVAAPAEGVNALVSSQILPQCPELRSPFGAQLTEVWAEFRLTGKGVDLAALMLKDEGITNGEAIAAEWIGESLCMPIEDLRAEVISEGRGGVSQLVSAVDLVGVGDSGRPPAPDGPVNGFRWRTDGAESKATMPPAAWRIANHLWQIDGKWAPYADLAPVVADDDRAGILEYSNARGHRDRANKFFRAESVPWKLVAKDRGMGLEQA